MTLLASGCTSTNAFSGIPVGNAIPPQSASKLGPVPMRPGFELGFLYVTIQNSSNEPIVIRSVIIRGPGIRNAVRPARIRMAPLRAGYHHNYIMNATVGGTFMTYPPVFTESHGCHKQALHEVNGFRMSPGSIARIFVVLRAIRTGKFAIPYHVVLYDMNGTEYRQDIPTKITGFVSKTARVLPVPDQQANCVKPSPRTISSRIPVHRSRYLTHRTPRTPEAKPVRGTDSKQACPLRQSGQLFAVTPQALYQPAAMPARVTESLQNVNYVRPTRSDDCSKIRAERRDCARQVGHER